MGVDKRQLEAFQKRLRKMNASRRQQFMQQAVKDSAGAILGIVIPNTPVGDTREYHMGGALRRAWTCRTEQEAESGGEAQSADAFAETLEVERSGDSYSVDLVNPMHYASYVEYGHRQKPGRYVPAIGKRLVKGWVEGQFFLKESVTTFSEVWPAFLHARLDKFLKKDFR